MVWTIRCDGELVEILTSFELSASFSLLHLCLVQWLQLVIAVFLQHFSGTYNGSGILL